MSNLPQSLENRVVEAAKELLRRRKARNNLLSFIQYIDEDYILSDFSRTVCAELDQFLVDMADGLRPVLVLGAPPQHGKSQIVSRYLPAYIFGRHPDLRVGGLSYAKDLASDMNRDVQRIMMSDEYMRLFPESCLSAKRVVTVEVEAKRNSETFEIVGRKGSYVSQGVGGPLTGKRLDCFVAGTKVQTDIGLVNIEDLPMHAAHCKILSHNGKGLTYGRLKAFASSKGFGIYRVTTKSGRVFEATGDHRIYSGRGYVEASQLAEGDVLLCSVREASNKDGGGLFKDAQGWRKCWELLLNKVRGICYASKPTDMLRYLWEKVFGWWSQVLLQGVHACDSIKVSSLYQDLRNVHDNLQHNERAKQGSEVLWKELRQSAPCAGNDGGKQSKIQEWAQPSKDSASLRKGLSTRKAVSFGAGWVRMRSMLKEWMQARGSSYGWMGEQQRIIEFGDSMREVPQRSPSVDGFREVRDYVAKVERVRESSTVYDIQVEGDSNFFANGVLVHNCGIIDDPIKNSKEALSQTVKDGIWNWYVSTFLTRLSKNSGQIIMATRWATDDLSGKVIEKNKKAKVLAFKAISDAGIALVPELHPIDKLLETKATLGEYFWSAMYQQSPVALGGNMFKSDWWQYYDIAPTFRHRAIFADTAQKTKEQNDYSVFQCWGFVDGRAYLIDQLRGKWEAPELLVMARAFWNKHKSAGTGTLRAFNIEDKSSGTGLIQTLKKGGNGQPAIPVKAIQRDKDKITRAMDALPSVEAGLVYLPREAPFLSDYLEEASAFPNGAHDDQLDPTMDAITEISKPKFNFFA